MVHGGTPMIIGLLPITLTGRRALEEFVLIDISPDTQSVLGLAPQRPKHFAKGVEEILPDVDAVHGGAIFARERIAQALDATGITPLEMIPTNFTTVIMVKTAREAYQLGLIGAPKSDELAIFGKGTSVRQFIGSIGSEVKPIGELTIGAYFRKITPTVVQGGGSGIIGKQAILERRGLYERRTSTR